MADKQYIKSIELHELIADVVDSMRDTNSISEVATDSSNYKYTAANSLSKDDYISITDDDGEHTNEKIISADDYSFTIATEYATASVYKSNAPYFEHDKESRAAEILTEKSGKGIKVSWQRYPLVLLTHPYTSDHSNNMNFDVPFSIFIIHNTKNEYRSDDRYTNVLDSIIFPIYEKLLTTLAANTYVYENDPYYIKHSKTDLLNVDGNPFPDHMDGVKLDFDNLRINTPRVCESTTPTIKRPLTIAIDGDGVTVPAVGSYQIENGTTQQLIAAPNEGSKFSKWEINEEPFYYPVQNLVVDGLKKAIAYFTEIITSTYYQFLPLGIPTDLDNIGTGGDNLNGSYVSGSMSGKDLVININPNNDSTAKDKLDELRIPNPEITYAEMAAIKCYPQYEQKQPYFINYIDIVGSTPLNSNDLNEERSIIKLTNTSFSIVDTARMIVGYPLVIKLIDDTFDFAVITEVDGNTITINNTITKDFSTAQDILAANGDPLHLCRNAYKGIAQKIANYTNKYTERKNIILNGDVQLGDPSFGSDPKLYKLSDASVLLDFEYLPDSTFNSPSGNYASPLTSVYYLIQSTVLDYGISLSLGELNNGSFININANIRDDSGNYGTYDIELVNSNNEIVDTYTVNQFVFLKTIYFDIETTDNYTLNFKNKTASTFTSILNLRYIKVYDSIGDDSNILESGKTIAMLGDSWSNRVSELPFTLHPDGESTDGESTMLTYLCELLDATQINFGLSGATSEWGRYWVNELVKLKPDYCIVNFGINDYQGRSNYPSTVSTYDFDPNNTWSFLSSSLGGEIGSVDKDRYVENMQFIIQTLLDNSIIPIILNGATITTSIYQNGTMLWGANLLTDDYENNIPNPNDFSLNNSEEIFTDWKLINTIE